MKISIAILVLVEIFSASLCFSQYDNVWMLGNHYGNPAIYPKFGADFIPGYLDTFSLFRPMPFFMTNTAGWAAPVTRSEASELMCGS